ncbi:MAG: XRE family transcriptional regulator [Lactobacillus sp.]|nr:MAG: XRE family transcriptional regulator [Lactobacillus sp.]
MNANILGPVIKDFRQKRHMTQIELSDLTGIAQNTISNHENQNRALDENDIASYAKAFNVTPQDLFNAYSSNDTSMIAATVAVMHQLNVNHQSKVYDFAKEQLADQQHAAEDQGSTYAIDDPALASEQDSLSEKNN